MRAVRPATMAHRTDEVLLAPASNSGLRMRCDVWTKKYAVWRLECAPPGIRLGSLPLLGMASDAARRLSDIHSALGVCSRTEARRRCNEKRRRKQKPRRERGF